MVVVFFPYSAENDSFSAKGVRVVGLSGGPHDVGAVRMEPPVEGTRGLGQLPVEVELRRVEEQDAVIDEEQAAAGRFLSHLRPGQFVRLMHLLHGNQEFFGSLLLQPSDNKVAFA